MLFFQRKGCSRGMRTFQVQKTLTGRSLGLEAAQGLWVSLEQEAAPWLEGPAGSISQAKEGLPHHSLEEWTLFHVSSVYGKDLWEAQRQNQRPGGHRRVVGTVEWMGPGREGLYRAGGHRRIWTSASLRKGQEEAGEQDDPWAAFPTEPAQGLGQSSRTKASKCVWPRRGNCSLALVVSWLVGERVRKLRSEWQVRHSAECG